MTHWAVTGATGFVGRHLLRSLARQGVSTRALGRSADGVADAVEQVHLSLLDPQALTDALAGCDVLVHLAAPRRPARGGHRPGDPDLLVRSGEVLLRAALAAGVRRCVFASSTSVFGPSWTTVDEESTEDPRTPYARQKLEGDVRVLGLARERGAEVVILRMSEIFGPGSNAHGGLIRAVERGDMRVVGSGRQPHDLLEVHDAARALVAAGRVAVSEAATLLVVSGPGNSFRGWIQSIADAAGTEVTFTPVLDRPGRWALRLAGTIPGMDRLPRYVQVDYQVRPRAYDVARSLAALGDYHESSFGPAVRAMVAHHRAEPSRA